MRTHDCPDCGRRFGGTDTYDRHLDRRHDRCKSEATLRRLGIVPNAEGIYSREPIKLQPTLIDLRSVARVPQTTRRARALALAEDAGVQTGEDLSSGAPARSSAAIQVPLGAAS